jgi:hypothetical protein
MACQMSKNDNDTVIITTTVIDADEGEIYIQRVNLLVLPYSFYIILCLVNILRVLSD